MDLRVFYSDLGAEVDWGRGQRRCAIGPAGIGAKTQEGDGVTPRGSFALRRIFYRADRLAPPKTMLPIKPIAENDGWCDAPADQNYNRLVRLPYPASAEHLWRDDRVYDLIAVVGFNDDPVMAGKGSAIFLHLAKPDFAPTAGCVALEQKDLLEALAQFRPEDRVRIG